MILNSTLTPMETNWPFLLVSLWFSEMQTSNVERIILTGSSLKDFHVTACQLPVTSVGPPCVTFSGDFKSFRSFSTHMNVKSIHYLPIISQMKVIYYVYLFFYMLQQMAGLPGYARGFFLIWRRACPSRCHQALAHRESFDFGSFLCII